MQKTIAIFGIMLMGALPVWADGDTPAGQAGRLTVTGQGVADVAPDMAQISLGVTKKAALAPGAMDAVAQVTAAILARLEAVGVEARDVQTSRISLSPEYNYNRNNDAPPKLVGFQANSTLNVRVRDLDRLGEIISAVTQDGANEFHGLSFGLQTPGAAQDEARAKAVEDARHQAEVLAAAAGVSLGRVISISEGASRQPGPAVMRMAMESDVAAMPVAAGELAVSANVNIVYELVEE